MLNDLIYATLGTIGFGLLFNANKNKYIFIAIGGFLNYFGYLLTYEYTSNIFISSIISAMITFLYSNLLAKILKCPSTIFILTGLISIVPGSSLFYMMQNFVLGNSILAAKHAITAIEVILGIVSGILISSAFGIMIKQFLIRHIIKN